ncbi:MAG TPA: surface-adhesin E family protein [Allosphingosinicella sp.]|nr:surface-adhesin E family protein [Allosphingosinicella sp.]
MIIRRNKKVRLALLVAAGAALTSLLASELLPSRGKQAAALPEWVEIGVATDGTRAFVNRNSIAETGERVALRQRFTLGRARAKAEAAEAVEQLAVYDCRARIVSTLESRELGGGGTVLRSQRFRPPVQDSIRGGSLPEYIFEAVC